MEREARMVEAAAAEQGERVAWEYQHVTLTRVPGYGFGIAVSGGRDNPHFSNGDPAIAISDVLKAGPAEGKLMVNDRIISANGISLENVEYATAVQVLRDSGNTVLLVVRRRVVQPACPEPQTIKLCLTKSKKKDDFGLVLGCKIYVRELSGKNIVDNREGGSLQEGDVLLKINNHTTDGMTLKEARKLIESSKEKLNLVVRREQKHGNVSCESTSHPKESQGTYLESLSGPNYSSQNLYVQPPTRHPPQHSLAEDKSNLLPRGRSRGPLLDVSLSQLDRLATPVGAGPGHHHAHHRSRSGVEDGASPPDPRGPPRPPPPRPEGTGEEGLNSLGAGLPDKRNYYSSRRQLYEDDPLLQRSKQPMPDPRFITFQKEGSVGIRLTGGNEVGIFVTAVQPGSPASLQGLQPGDKILKVNDMDMKGVTREEAVLFLLSLQDQIDLIVQYRKEEYEQIVASQRGDSFHIKAHFNYDQPNKGEMSFRKGDVFHVVDTLHNGVVGSWQVFRIGRNNQEVQKGIIPNKSRAEELATAQFNATKKELTASESRGSFFRRRRGSHRRSKSLGRDHWDDVVFADSISKFPAYERVVLRHPGFVRPVVLFGPVADIAREKMLKDFPDKFTSPQLDNNLEDIPKSQKSSGIIRLSAIREIMDRGKHALLDITPNAVDRLNYAQFYPIVIFLRAESKHIIKELRAGLSKAAHKSSKKLFEQCQKLEKVWGHTFSCSITLTSPELWYRKVRELIDKQQTAPVWMSESKPDEALSDDFLFPMTSRLSYASSPESDLDLSPEPRCNAGTTAQAASARLVKSSSDPSIATQEDAAPGYSAPPPYSPSGTYNKQNYESHNGAPPPDHHHGHNLIMSQGKRRSQCGDSKYGFSPPHLLNTDEPPISSSTMHLNYPPHHHHYHHHQTSSPAGYPASKMLNGGAGALPRSPLMHSPPLQKPPELPPRIDRTNKPPHGALSRLTAADRLFVKGEGGLGDADLATGAREVSDPPNYINATPHHRRGGSSSLERHNVKASSYDSVSSYESYNNRLGPNAHDDLKCGSNGVPLSPRNHDPYRFTRSTAQPISSMEPKPNKHPDYGKYRSGDYKPLPPPKTGSYKPVPPPKPKNYRPPPPENQAQWSRGSGDGNYDIQHSPQRTLDSGMSSSPIGTLRNDDGVAAAAAAAVAGASTLKGGSNVYQHSKPYSLSSGLDAGFSSAHQNGGEDLSAGFDSGHGSSLDRNYNNPMHVGSSSSQYYHNISPARGGLREGFHNHNHHGHHNHEPSGLDLTNREQRGSAFELYKKPTDMRGNTMHQYLENNLR